MKIKNNETLDDIREDAKLVQDVEYWRCESVPCETCQICNGKNPCDYYEITTCDQAIQRDLIERTKDAVQREYEDRVYEWFKNAAKTHAITYEKEELVAKILGTPWMDIRRECLKRWQSETDTLEQIRLDAQYPIEINPSAWALDLIERTIAVMERDKDVR